MRAIRNGGAQLLTPLNETHARTAATSESGISSRFPTGAAREDSTGSLGGGVANVASGVAMEGFL